MKSKRWILIRGLTRSRFHWLGFDELLKKELDLDIVECPEIPGNGYLFNERSLSSIDATVNYLRKQVGGITEPVGLLGISMGGMIANRWAAMHPHEVEQLVLINTSSSLSPSHERLNPKNYFTILKSLMNSNAEIIETTVMNLTSNRPEKWKPHLPLLAQFQREHPVSLINFMLQIKLSSKADFSEKPQQPVLILTSHADHLVNMSCSLKIAEQWQMPLVVHSTAGHDLTLDDPMWVIEKIKEHS
ncbi:MAG: alpha/beta hydrolase [Bdellovibrio sp.]|nr:alpha/beta hydrolase [Bdellovibrio sp.]